MSGQTDLDGLLASITPELVEGVFVFVTRANREVPAGIHPRMVFEEAEGTTLIVLKVEAEAAGMDYEFPCRMITLSVHSSLSAIGFMARITNELARYGISVNPVSGYYHDHLFVPEARAGEALQILSAL